VAKLIEVVEPTEKEYVVRLSQSEVDFIMGIISDLADNPYRRVRVAYETDDSYVKPSEKGMEIVKGLLDTGLAAVQSDDYDWFSYWDEVEHGEE
jgi:hypothetical protein